MGEEEEEGEGGGREGKMSMRGGEERGAGGARKTREGTELKPHILRLAFN